MGSQHVTAEGTVPPQDPPVNVVEDTGTVSSRGSTKVMPEVMMVAERMSAKVFIILPSASGLDNSTLPHLIS